MLRLVLVVGLLIVLYFLLRNVVRDWFRQGRAAPPQGDGHDMVQDPVCRMYVPRRTAIEMRQGTQTYYFCSQDCAKTFREGGAAQHPE